MKKINFYNFFILIIISLLLAIFFVGPINFWFSSTNWLYSSGDLSNAQLGWKFLKMMLGGSQSAEPKLRIRTFKFNCFH